ncbi:MAG: hypothetical protein ABIG95_06190 [Candidatus Woesearchaeota archaeon]
MTFGGYMKKRYLVGLCVLFIFLNGCSGCEDSNGPDPSNYHSGTVGITMNFMTNSPPLSVYHGSVVPFFLEVRNLGAQDASPNIWITGHDPEIVVITTTWNGANTGLIPGRGDTYPAGGYATLEAKDVPVNLPEGVDTYSANMKVTACYTYSTLAAAQVCVDPDPTQNQDDACAVHDVSLSGGQGAPVAVTHVKEETSSAGDVVFAITIENQGDGTIINSAKVGACTTDVKASDLDMVTLTSVKLSSKSITDGCNPRDPLRMVNGKGVIYCKTNVAGNAYSTALQVEISYGYKSSISKTINVRKV